MAPEVVEKPRVTEIQVRMDCNGCVQKIKKALHGINGINDLYVDFPQQKLTIIGWADPEKIIKAIRKTRKIATICSHTEPVPTPQPTEQKSNSSAEPTQEAPNPPQAEAPPAAEPPKESPPPPDNPPPEVAEAPLPTPVANATNAQPTGPRDVGGVHVIYHHPPPDYSRYGYRHSYGGEGLPQDPPQPMYATHSYNTHRPSPYVTEYDYIRSPPRYTYYNTRDQYNEDYHSSSSSGNGNITSIFSDENPNACSIA